LFTTPLRWYRDTSIHAKEGKTMWTARAVALGLVSAFVVGIVSAADAAVLCAPKSGAGTIKVREVCKRNETPLDPATVGLESTGPAAYDANGNKVGKVISTNTHSAVVPLKVADHSPFTLLVAGNRLIPNSAAVFESTDCSGTLYLEEGTIDSDRVWSRAGVAPPGRTVYLAEIGTPLRTITIGSLWNPTVNTCVPVNRDGQVFPATPVIDLSTLFTPPFSVR
jgi:hypothetical protein